MAKIKMENIKICFFTREYAHQKLGKTGGIGVFVKRHVQLLVQHNFDVHIFTFGSEQLNFQDGQVRIFSLKDREEKHDRIRSLYRKTKLPGYIKLKLFLERNNRKYIAKNLKKYCINNQIQIVELHDYGGDAAYFKYNLPMVIRCHGSATTLHKFMGYINRLADTTFERKLFRNTNSHIVAVSNYSAITTQSAFDLKTTPKVIYNGVDSSVLELDSTSNKSTKTQIKSIYYVGSIRERKGIDIACNAFNELIKKHEEATFHVMGNNNNDYWNTNAVKELSKEALNSTHYLGVLSSDKVLGELKKAHVVIFPSYGENFSLALLEALALGKIVVVSNIPSFQEIIISGKNGFVANKVEDYVDIIDDIFLNKVNRDLIEGNAIHTINEKFNSDKILQQNIDFYKSVLKLSD